MDFLKSYATDYYQFKKRWIDAGGNDLSAKMIWQHLIGSDLWMKKEALQQVKDRGINVKDLDTLRNLVKSLIIKDS